MSRQSLHRGYYPSRSASLQDIVEVPLRMWHSRGNANLTAPHLSDAEADFQEILDHRGMVVNSPVGALAHLGLARAYALENDIGKARSAYHDFLTLWKDADPDIPF